jgi:hypothetical protein
MTNLMINKNNSQRFLWAAAIIGGLGTLAEAFIAVATLLSGYSMGVYDLVGAACGLLALALVRRYPLLAALLWMVTMPLLYSGGLLVSIACLPVLALPLIAAGLALWSWYVSRKSS